jgi:hypothetical protein
MSYPNASPFTDASKCMHALLQSANRAWHSLPLFLDLTCPPFLQRAKIRFTACRQRPYQLSLQPKSQIYNIRCLLSMHAWTTSVLFRDLYVPLVVLYAKSFIFFLHHALSHAAWPNLDRVGSFISSDDIYRVAA